MGIRIYVVVYILTFATFAFFSRSAAIHESFIPGKFRPVNGRHLDVVHTDSHMVTTSEIHGDTLPTILLTNSQNSTNISGNVSAS